MTREELNAYPILIQEVQWLTGRIESLRARIDSPRIPALTGQPGARSSGPGSHQERLADEYMDSAPRYEEQLRGVRLRIRNIEDAVDQLPDKERMVTRWHCLERLSYKYIADTMELSISTVAMIQKSAYTILEGQDEIDRR